MDSSTPGAVTPATEHVCTEKDHKQLIWLLRLPLSKLNFNDRRGAAYLDDLDRDIPDRVRDTAAAIEKGLEAAVFTRSKQSNLNALGEGFDEMTLDQVPEQQPSHVGLEENVLRIPGLNSQPLAQWNDTFEATLGQHRVQGKTAGETVVSQQKYKDRVNIFLKVVGKEGQQHCQTCLSAKGVLDKILGSFSEFGATLEASNTQEECLAALQRLRHNQNLQPFSPTEHIQEPLDAPASYGRCVQEFKTSCKLEAIQAEAWRREVLATMEFSEQWIKIAAEIRVSSEEWEFLVTYSATKGRYLKRGVNRQDLLVEFFVDHLTTSSDSEVRQKIKNKLFAVRRDGRWYSALHKEFGPGVFYFLTKRARTSLRNLSGRQITEVFIVFLESTAATFPNLKTIFDYCNNAVEDELSATFESVAPPESLQELISNITQNPLHTFNLIEGADVLNKEFKPQSTESQNRGNAGAVNAANSLLDQFGETDGDDGGNGNGNRPEAQAEGETGLHQDEDQDDTSEDERGGNSDSREQGQMADNNVKDGSTDDDDRLDDDDKDEGYEQENPAKRQKIGGLFVCAGRFN